MNVRVRCCLWAHNQVSILFSLSLSFFFFYFHVQFRLGYKFCLQQINETINKTLSDVLNLFISLFLSLSPLTREKENIENSISSSP